MKEISLVFSHGQLKKKNEQKFEYLYGFLFLLRLRDGVGREGRREEKRIERQRMERLFSLRTFAYIPKLIVLSNMRNQICEREVENNPFTQNLYLTL